MRYVAISILSLFLAFAAGCGQKGDLYLPKAASPESAGPKAPSTNQDDRDPVNVDRPPL